MTEPKPSFYEQFVTPEGVLRLYVDLRVDIDEMKQWKPERIRAYFHGLSHAMQAKFAND